MATLYIYPDSRRAFRSKAFEETCARDYAVSLEKLRNAINLVNIVCKKTRNVCG